MMSLLHVSFSSSLDSLDDVSESELDELEKQLEEAKKALDGANLEGEVGGAQTFFSFLC